MYPILRRRPGQAERRSGTPARALALVAITTGFGLAKTGNHHLAQSHNPVVMGPRLRGDDSQVRGEAIGINLRPSSRISAFAPGTTAVERRAHVLACAA